MYTTETQINEFIKEYASSRVVVESSLKAILNRATEYEERFDKPFYEFTRDEALAMFKGARSISATSLLNGNIILKHASNWIKYTKGINVTNAYEEITKDDLKLCVDASKKQKMIITREQLINIENELPNYTDRAILELLFRGVGVEDWARELTFLETTQISKRDMCIYFKNGKSVEIDGYCYKILMEAAKEEELLSYSTSRVSKVWCHGVIYKVRGNTITENDDVKDQKSKERRFRFVQRRVALINEYLGTNLTPTSVCDSGLLHQIRLGMALNDLPFRQYVATAEAREISQKFGIYSNHYGAILVEKFKGYFEE